MGGSHVDRGELLLGGRVGVPGRTGDGDADHLAVELTEEMLGDARFDLLAPADRHPLDLSLIHI